jgi:hypothetical protein
MHPQDCLDSYFTISKGRNPIISKALAISGMDELTLFIILATSATGALIAYVVRDYISFRKTRTKRATVAQRIHPRPISIVSRIEGAKKCSICLGIIKAELKGIDCGCGSSFHHSCALRVGICPICSGQIEIPESIMPALDEPSSEPIRSMPLSREDRFFLLEDRLLSGEIDRESYARLKNEILTNMPEPIFCANCGSKMYPGEKCHCIDDVVPKCPECGKAVAQGEDFCRSCGVILSENFQEALYQCSACGRIVSSKERICTCGAALFDPGDSVCPECGHPVPPMSESCPNCGRIRIINLLECPSCGREVGSNDFECDCGVIFQDRIERVECPECSAEVGLEDQFCKSCGVQFRKDGYSSVHKSIQ